MGREPEDDRKAAIAFRKSIREREPRSLKEWVRLRVVLAVERNLIAVDELGLAWARDPDDPRFELIEGTTEYRLARYRELLEERTKEAIRRGTHAEMVSRIQEIEDLTLILELGDAQETALRAVGAELTDVPAYSGMVMGGLARDVAVASKGRAPTATLARIQWIVDAEVVRRASKPTWLLGAETALTTVLTGARGVPRSPTTRELDGTKALGAFLELLARTADGLPKVLTQPTLAQRRKAADFLATLRVADLPAERQPAHVGRGRPLTLGGATEKLMAILGAHIPGRTRDRRRRQKN